MNLRSLFILAAVLITTAASAQNHELCSHGKQQQRIAAIPDFPKRPYDIFLYKLTLDLRNAFYVQKPIYSGKAEIHLNTTSETQTIQFDAALQTMTKVVVNDEEIIPTPQPDNNILTIPLAQSLQAIGTHLTIVIEYERSSDENRGAFFYPKGYFVGLGPEPAEDSIFVEEDLFYTMSEPFDARYWMPCNDQPHDKMEAQIYVYVPSDIKVTSNGELVLYEPGDATDRWLWKSDRPLSSYLMVVNASKFASWNEKVARFHDPADSVALSYHVWQPDFDQTTITDGSKYNAHHAFRNTSSMVTAFEKRFGPYPFASYGQTVVQPITIGGMEHQTMTTVNRVWLRGKSEGGIAHELGHQWFGDKVTCETFKDLWLNEGFATYTEAIFNESWGGYEWYFSAIGSKARGYFDAPQHGVRNDFPIYDPPNGELFNGAITYNKAGCVIHLLRRLVNNDSSFFGALQTYLDDFAYSNANTASFKSAMSSALALDLDEFFDQWIYGAMHPEFSILWGQNANNKLYLRINQLQTVRDHFTMPLRFFAYHGTTIDTINVTVASRTESWNGIVNGTIDSLVFDQDFGILATYSLDYDGSLGVHEMSEAMSITLNPIANEIVCRSTSNANYHVEIYDALGKRVLDQHAFSTVERIPTASFTNGIYIVRMTDGAKTIVRSIPIVK
jgi:aminopeptidase N